MKLDYILPLLNISSDLIDGLTPLQFNKKIQKMNRQLLVKNLDSFPQNSSIFLQILMIHDLKKHVSLENHAVFQLLLESTFSLEAFLALK